MNKLAALLSVVLIPLLAGCATTDALLKEQRVNELTLERDSLTRSRDWFSVRPVREQQADMILFASTDVLNRIFRGVEGTEFALPGHDSVKIRVENVKAAFRDGFPLIVMDAVATAPGWFGPLTLDLEVSAALDLDPIFLYAPDTPARIRVLKVVPRVRYLFFRSDVKNAIDAIVTAEAATYAEHLPEFTLPLQHKLAIDIPSEEHWQEMKLPSNWTMFGFVTTPAVARDLILNVTQVLALQNGLYVFARVSVQAR